MMNKAIKIRLYPTEAQAIMFAKTFGCCRKVWNLMLGEKIESHKLTQHFKSRTPAGYKAEFPYLKEVDSLALANVQMHLQQAMKNCFESKHCEFPKFKSKRKAKKRYTTNNQGNTIELFEDGIKLPKIGKVKAEVHRLPEDGWVLKSVTISQASDGKYYASVLFEYEPEPIDYEIDVNNSISMDYKSDGLYADSEGNIADMPHFFRESQKKLAKEQRRLSRKVGARKGEDPSNNFKKQMKKVGKVHCHVSNQRKDFLHKKSTEIANQYDVVYVEDLNMRAMSNKGFGNGKATMDNGYGMLLDMLEYKLADRGKRLIKVDKWYPSSQLCSYCGKRHKEMKNTLIREMDCDCGNRMDRDYNAALNIKKEGRRILLGA